MCRWHTNKAPTGAAAETRGYRGRAPKPYLFLPKMQEGKEKQSGGLFFRRGTHMRGPPRTAAGGAYFATLPDCRTQRPVYT